MLAPPLPAPPAACGMPLGARPWAPAPPAACSDSARTRPACAGMPQHVRRSSRRPQGRWAQGHWAHQAAHAAAKDRAPARPAACSAGAGSARARGARGARLDMAVTDVIGGGERERQVLDVAGVVAQQQERAVQLRVQRGQVVQVAAAQQQLLQEEVRERQLQQDTLPRPRARGPRARASWPLAGKRAASAWGQRRGCQPLRCMLREAVLARVAQEACPFQTCRLSLQATAQQQRAGGGGRRGCAPRRRPCQSCGPGTHST